MDGSEAKVSRRGFLRRAAAAAAAPYVLTSAALGQRARRAGRGRAPRRGRAAASDRVTMGFIGVGQRGGSLMSAFAGTDRAQILAVCDVDATKRRHALARAGRRATGCTAHNDFREVLARKDIDAVVVATPDHWHAIIAVEAARAGKDVYCESPLSLTIREARAMASAARRYGQVFQCGAAQRSTSACRTACEMIRSGRIGQVMTVHARAGNPSQPCSLPAQPVPKGLDWDRWLGPAPQAPFNRYRYVGPYSGSYGWWMWRDYAGGYMTFHGAHMFDVIHWALGLDDTGPVEIVPPDLKKKQPLTFRYANGTTVYSATGPHKMEMEFTGTKGVLGATRYSYRTWPEAIARRPISGGEVHLRRSDNHLMDFLGCVRSRRRPITDAAVAARFVSACHLGNIACWLDRALKWDPAKEQFVNDPAANRWVDRPKRAPWHL